MTLTYPFFEAYRGSMPLPTFTQTTIFKKPIAYHATATGQLHAKLFGIQTFRVLTVTDSLQGIFLFADERSLLEGDTLAHFWLNGRN